MLSHFVHSVRQPELPEAAGAYLVPELATLLESLGISADIIAAKRLRFHPLAAELVVAEIDAAGDVHQLVPGAAAAWHRLKRAARQDGVMLEIVSAFRDIDCQANIIREKIARNMPMETILTLSAPPGYSEHHTGEAVDVNTPGCEAREAPFADTDAYRWLISYAGQFGFTLSYPPGNEDGFIHEPWHWRHRPPQRHRRENSSSKESAV